MYHYFRNRFRPSLQKRLEKIDHNNIPRFSFKGINTYAFVCKVYDGDTITIVFEYKGDMIKYSTRIYGIDTPEIRTKDDDEKKRGYAARDFLSSYILNKVVKIELLEFDKYGRLLANVFANIGGNYINVSNLLIQNNHAKPYFGGKK